MVSAAGVFTFKSEERLLYEVIWKSVNGLCQANIAGLEGTEYTLKIYREYN
jgi:hypothetical protein